MALPSSTSTAFVHLYRSIGHDVAGLLGLGYLQESASVAALCLFILLKTGLFLSVLYSWYRAYTYFRIESEYLHWHGTKDPLPPMLLHAIERALQGSLPSLDGNIRTAFQLRKQEEEVPFRSLSPRYRKKTL